MMVADDFKPASIDTAQHAVIDIEQGNKVKVTVPHIEVGVVFQSRNVIDNLLALIRASYTEVRS